MHSLINQLETDGYAVVDNIISPAETKSLIEACGRAAANDARAGIREVHKLVPAVAALLESVPIRTLIEEILAGGFPVRTILFDKTPAANWGVPWHQDLTICVQEKHEMAGFGPWSLKEGLVHVQPPVEILEQMVTLRLHLDACPPENGALKVIPGSHTDGRLSAKDILRISKKRQSDTCAVGPGGGFLMKPLVLHSSSPSVAAMHRRVLHAEFAAQSLPSPLKWLQ